MKRANTMKTAALPLLALLAPSLARATDARPVVVTPPSSKAHPHDHMLRAHTNYRLLLPGSRGDGVVSPDSKAHNPMNETPASLACIYGLAPRQDGCLSTKVTANAAGGSKMIAIVDAYHYRTAVRDLGQFSETFGLPPVTGSNFQIVYADGHRPQEDRTGGWELEEALDIEMAHGMAPGAQIALVEARSDSCVDLLTAADVAGNLVAQAGGGEVSMSWSCAEFPTERHYNKRFAVPGVVYFAATGDAPGTGWPAVMQNVVAVGGTFAWRAPTRPVLAFQSAGNFGGGPSVYIPRPAYQDAIKSIVGSVRGTPDVSAYFCGGISDQPAYGCVGGAWVYDTTPVPIYGALHWTAVIGTSVATPVVAAIVNTAGHFYTSSADELSEIYAVPYQDDAFRDIVTYGCTLANGSTIEAGKGWDFCTGIGTPFGLADK